MANVDVWANAVNQWAEGEFKAILWDVQRAVAFNLAFLVVRNTPVWEARDSDPPGYSKHTGGRAKGSWQVSTGTPSAEGYTAELGSTAAEQQALGKIGAALDAIQGFPLIYLTTPIKYMRVLEFGEFPNPPKVGTGRTAGGYSIQAPTGMVRVNAEQVRRQIDSIVRAVIARRIARRKLRRRAFGIDCVSLKRDDPSHQRRHPTARIKRQRRRGSAMVGRGVRACRGRDPCALGVNHHQRRADGTRRAPRDRRQPARRNARHRPVRHLRPIWRASARR